MTTALVAEERSPAALAAPVVTADQLDLVKRTVASGATDAELKLYLYDCSRQGVHPLDRLLHFTKRGGKYTPVTSIDLMRTRAADTNEYAGNDDAVFEYEPLANLAADHTKPPRSASVTVWRLVRGHRCGFTATARWSEYYPGDAAGTMWRKMPCTMLAKCAEALALRKGFPRQLAGLYAAEEMDQAQSPAPAKSALLEPPAVLVDVSKGVEVSNAVGATKPEPPPGYAYLEAVEISGGWCNCAWMGTPYKTKLSNVMQVVEHAYQMGLPVKVHSKRLPFLDKVEIWKPELDDSTPFPSDEDMPL
jgi:phage recombination protein Bet